MRILGACIFSKSFGGKITLFNQVLLTEQKKIKLAHAYLRRPYFSKFLGGKIFDRDIERRQIDK